MAQTPTFLNPASTGRVLATGAQLTNRESAVERARLVMIQRDALARLDSGMLTLPAYVRAFIVLSEQQIALDNFQSVLDAAGENRERFRDRFYVQQVKRMWLDIKPMTNSLETLRTVRPALGDVIASHDVEVSAGLEAADRITDPSQSADAAIATKQVFESFRKIFGVVRQLAGICRDSADNDLNELAQEIGKIHALDEQQQQERLNVRPRIKAGVGERPAFQTSRRQVHRTSRVAAARNQGINRSRGRA